MVSHDEPSPKKKNGNKQKKIYKSKQASTDPSEDGCTYRVDLMNLGQPANDLESESESLLTQCREGQMEKKNYRNNCTKHEYTVLTNFLNPIKCANSKINHYSQILQCCTKTRSRGGEF